MTDETFPLRGLIEGFYGVFYTLPERLDMIRFAGRHGFNAYIYAPKNDRQHRARWWEPYPERILHGFAQAARVARESGVSFCYAIAPGASIRFSSPADFERLTAKLCQFYRLGVRDFSLLLDDIDPEFTHLEDRQAYSSYAQAQADLSNRLYAWLQGLDPGCRLSMCPTDYYGRAPFSPYLHELGRSLDPGIEIFYTGPEICSPAITADECRDFARAAGRPPLLWDNYPVNDLAMKAELHLGPLLGRAADLHRAVRGYCANLMPQAEACKIPLATAAAYLADPHGYDPQRSWRAALLEAAGQESLPALELLAENLLHSCVSAHGSGRLDCLAGAVLAALQAGESVLESPAVGELDRYLQSLDEACYQLRYRMENLALRENLLPWIELMDHWQDMGRRAIRVLECLESGRPYARHLYFLKEMRAAALAHPKRLDGASLLPLADIALQRVAAVETG